MAYGAGNGSGVRLCCLICRYCQVYYLYDPSVLHKPEFSSPLWHCCHSLHLFISCNHPILCCFYYFKRLFIQLRINKSLFYFYLTLLWPSFFIYEYIWISDVYNFPSLWKTYFIISWKASLLSTNSLSFYLSEKVFHFLKSFNCLMFTINQITTPIFSSVKSSWNSYFINFILFVFLIEKPFYHLTLLFYLSFVSWELLPIFQLLL